jgi:hypothetical protein
VIPRLALFLLLSVLGRGAFAQLTWQSLPLAPNTGALVFDSHRDRLVAIATTSIWEYDGTAWVRAMANLPFNWLSWAVFDEGRQTTTFCADGRIYDWDGTAIVGGTLVPSFVGGVRLVTYHPGLLELVMAVSIPTVQGLALYSWNGQYLTLLPAGVPPPTLNGPNEYGYHSMTCDRVTGSIVLFGRTELPPSGPMVGTVPIMWEWHPLSGWTNLGSSGTFYDEATLWFDEHRAKVMRCNTLPLTQNLQYQSGANIWASMPLQGGSVQMSATRIAGYDALRNRVYAYNGHSSAPGPGFLADVYPAVYDRHQSQPLGCWTMFPTGLWLSQPSSRAWIGGTLSVDLLHFNGLAGPIALLAMGFDDQSFGGNPLPLSLSPVGMTGCVLHVDAQVVIDAVVTAGAANVSIPIPNQPLLVGTEFFQQAFGFVPGANPLNMLPSYSTRGTIGRSH